ncbi:MAG: hypothetical protein IPG92_00105 [Flavobacteriales bacterium]|nr:hypothetical protein [Flavobacteriales bacterium]
MQAPVEAVRIERTDKAGTSFVDDLARYRGAVGDPSRARSFEGRAELRLSVTMRTPGHDQELALGYLFTEGPITSVIDCCAWSIA